MIRGHSSGESAFTLARPIVLAISVVVVATAKTTRVAIFSTVAESGLVAFVHEAKSYMRLRA
jgi:hypothetical protein